MPARRPLLLAVACALLAAPGACGSGGPSPIDPFPIPVSTAQGAIALRARIGGGAIEPAILDTFSPLTVVDAHEPGEPIPEPSRRSATVELVAGAGAPVARAEFTDVTIVDAHPCAGDAACGVGLDGAEAEMRVLLGANLLSSYALRIDVPAQEIRLLPDIAGDDAQYAAVCGVAMDSPYAGGGTLVIGGGEPTYVGRRVTLQACAASDPSGLDVPNGADMLLVLTTAVSPTLLSETAWARYLRVSGDRQETPSGVVHLPSGPVAARFGRLPGIVLVGEYSSSRGPCEEVRAGRLMAAGGCDPTLDACPPPDAQTPCCPCATGQDYCNTAGAVELSADLPVAIVADDEPTLQAVRQELRPARPEVDGLLGLAALAAMRVDLDYPNDRLLMYCSGPGCAPRPGILSRAGGDVAAACAAAD